MRFALREGGRSLGAGMIVAVIVAGSPTGSPS